MFKKDGKLHISDIFLSYEAQEVLGEYLSDKPTLSETELLRNIIVTIWKQGGRQPITYRSPDKKLELSIRFFIDVLHEWTTGETSFSVQVGASSDDTFDPIMLDYTSKFECLDFSLN